MRHWRRTSWRFAHCGNKQTHTRLRQHGTLHTAGTNNNNKPQIFMFSNIIVLHHSDCCCDSYTEGTDKHKTSGSTTSSFYVIATSKQIQRANRARTQIYYTHESFHSAAQGSQFDMKSPLYTFPDVVGYGIGSSLLKGAGSFVDQLLASKITYISAKNKTTSLCSIVHSGMKNSLPTMGTAIFV